jgi:MFS family permease
VDSFVPLTLTELHGYSPAAAGVPLMVSALGWSAGSWLQSRWVSVPRHQLVRLGFALLSAGAASLVTVAFHGVPGWLAAPLWTMAGAGMGLAMATASVLMLELSPKDERGQNSAALQICDMLASASCVGLGGVLLATMTGGSGATPAAVAVIDLLMAGVAAVGVAVSGRVRRPEG